MFVYGILPAIAHEVVNSTEWIFFIDGQDDGAVPAPSRSPEFSYNFLLYSNTTLPYGVHNITLQNGAVGGPRSVVLLDYFVYVT